MAILTVNDKAQEVSLPLTLSDLIKINKVLNPELVSVQVNEEFVDRDVWPQTQLKDGDRVDFLYFMGGGSHD